MSHYLKVKVAIAILAAIIISIVILLETAFFAPVIHKRWQPLSWDDFDGIPPIFTRYGAAISSFIDVEYDSARSTYTAYAAQYNVGSWVKRDSTEQAYMLRHEQYHFNISEVFARQLNQYINENPEGAWRLFDLRLESLNLDKRKMQKRYDDETDHGSISSIQWRWEFRIDSLLMLDRGWVTDYFSGAKAYFPSPPDSSKYATEQTAARAYSLSKYGMYFGLTSVQGPATKSDFIKNVSGIIGRQYGVKSSSIDSVNNLRFLMVSDSAGLRSVKVWIKEKVYIYFLHTQYVNNSPDTIAYTEMSNTFINSFHVLNTDNYWLGKLRTDAPETRVEKTFRKSEGLTDKRYQYLVYQADAVQGFYRGPLYSENGEMLIAYDFIVHPDSLHLKHILRLNDDLHISKPSPVHQLYWLPAASVPVTDSYVSLGFVLKKDSSQYYQPLHQHVVYLRPRKIDE